MSRKVINIEKDKLEAIILDLESKNTYPTQSALFMEAAEKYNSLHGVLFSHSCCGQRVKQFGIQIKTEKTKPGAHLKGGNIEAIKQWRETGEVKEVKAKVKNEQFLAYWAKEEGGKFLKIAKKAQRGNLKAKIKINCISCVACSLKEITNCELKECPFWDIRPYQK